MTDAGERLPFRMEEYFGEGHDLRLALVGELDLAVAQQLSDRLGELKKGGYAVTLDLSRLKFIDSSGLRELISAITESRRDGWTLTIDEQLTDQVRRVIDLVGARAHFWPEHA